MSNADTLRRQFASANPPRSLYPLLWLHGDPRETEETLRREIQAMDDAGCGGFVIESRPHLDYLGDGWWRDVGICLDEARSRGMEVWIFDEEYYPSGIAGGKVLTKMPDYRMLVLAKETFRWTGGQAREWGAASFADDAVLKVVCVREDTSERVALADLQALNAWADSEEAEGTDDVRWTIHTIGIKPSWSGRMFEKMVDYLCPEVTDCFIELTYEATKSRFPEYWGTTIKGFFGDETSFENFGSYDVLFGEETPCFPWSRVLLRTFAEAKGYDLVDFLELLWFDSGEQTARVRVDFMDHLTALFAENFFGRIQRWCHANDVRFIGHIVEDNHAHMHHGYGVGHFFRATKHFDMGGYDFVLRQFDSEQKRSSCEEHFPQFKHYRDLPYPDFFQYTLAKLAQSAAHLEVGTSLVMCENFGAYGWDLGLREMKWMTDWMTARGTNWYVPHAFSPIYPDPDCPPHFYAGGHNPLWPYFRQWGDYANRSCLMLREAQHVAAIAVLYPAEAHWAGDRDMLDGVCKALMRSQYDFDILSMDLLADEGRCAIERGELRIRDERFATIVLPGIRTLPPRVQDRLQAFARAGGRIVAVGEAAACGGENVELPQLASQLSRTLAPGIAPARPFPELRFCHYRKDGLDIFFLNNESVEETFEELVEFPADGWPERWSPMDGSIAALPLFDRPGGRVRAPVRLAPYEACFIVIRPDEEGQPGHLTTSDVPPDSWHRTEREADGSISVVQPVKLLSVDGWRVADIRSPVPDTAIPAAQAVRGLGNWHAYAGMETFSGSVVYEASVDLDTPELLHALDLGEVGEIAVVELNGHELPPRICPPYVWRLPPLLLKPRDNRFRVTVTNTLGPAFPEDGFRRDIPAPAGLIGPVTLTACEKRPFGSATT
ncbi:glycosyl hydrolase [Cohnella hashimotonis]|uniref:Glycosyl hydrolase n=1 Tax=Cohnella hashimotonis TaxID=2826895 RepID=A0ABT6T9P5_9BACL|nr:glycosyl hydrolase [Cohnella hashimotonis]MDI4643549.1 glycosyl hydrolase [Cohnella hashimotonis]